MLLLGVVSVSVAFESDLSVPNVLCIPGDGGGGSTFATRTRSGLAYGWVYSAYCGVADRVEECPKERSSRSVSAGDVMREIGEALDIESASICPTLDGVRERRRGSDSLSRRDCGEGLMARDVEDMDACASALGICVS